jgi:hypothetical protein
MKKREITALANLLRNLLAGRCLFNQITRVCPSFTKFFNDPECEVVRQKMYQRPEDTVNLFIKYAWREFHEDTLRLASLKMTESWESALNTYQKE